MLDLSGSPNGSRRCIYCNKYKNIQDFSIEHIFPVRLGGALCSDLFKTTDVCRGCNSTVGLFIDGAFIKNWFRTNDEALQQRQYLDLDSTESFLPLAYLGTFAELVLDNNQICELWLGARGETFHHFHNRDDPRWDTFAGGNPIERKKPDPGRVYLSLTSNDPRWIMLALRSMKVHFKQANRYAINFEVKDDDINSPFFHQMNEISLRETEIVKNLGRGPHAMRFSIDVGFDIRFLAKLARGLGYKIFGAGFLETTNAKNLLQTMWEKNSDTPTQSLVKGRGFFQTEAEEIDTFLAWPGAYTIRLQCVSDLFALTLHLPSGKALHICISDYPPLWNGPEWNQYVLGVVFLIIPPLGKFVGPLPMPEYIAHKLNHIQLPALAELDARRIDPRRLLPRNDAGMD